MIALEQRVSSGTIPKPIIALKTVQMSWNLKI